MLYKKKLYVEQNVTCLAWCETANDGEKDHSIYMDNLQNAWMQYSVEFPIWHKALMDEIIYLSVGWLLIWHMYYMRLISFSIFGWMCTHFFFGCLNSCTFVCMFFADSE